MNVYSSYQFLMENPQKGHGLSEKKRKEDIEGQKIYSSIEVSRNISVKTKYYHGNIMRVFVWYHFANIAKLVDARVANENDTVGAYWIKDWERMITKCGVQERERESVCGKRTTTKVKWNVYSIIGDIHIDPLFCGCTHVHTCTHIFLIRYSTRNNHK